MPLIEERAFTSGQRARVEGKPQAYIFNPDTSKYIRIGQFGTYAEVKEREEAYAKAYVKGYDSV